MGDSTSEERNTVKSSTDLFYQAEGRRPRLLLGMLHNPDLETINYLSSSMADLGFDIDIASSNLNLSQLLLQAQENDVHGLMIQVSTKDLTSIQNQLRDFLNTASDNETEVFLRSKSSDQTSAQDNLMRQVRIISDELTPVETAVLILDQLA